MTGTIGKIYSPTFEKDVATDRHVVVWDHRDNLRLNDGVENSFRSPVNADLEVRLRYDSDGGLRVFTPEMRSVVASNRNGDKHLYYRLFRAADGSEAGKYQEVCEVYRVKPVGVLELMVTFSLGIKESVVDDTPKVIVADVLGPISDPAQL